MGILWNDNSKTSALATYENGIIFKGDGFFREQIGTYNNDVVRDRYGNIVGRFCGNCINSPLAFSTTTYCNASYGTIYSGGSTFNRWIAMYDDDNDKGACAAALLYFGLHEATTVNGTNNYHSGNTYENNKNRSECSSVNTGITIPPEPGAVIGIVIWLIILFGISVAVYTTDWGQDWLFDNSSGLFTFGVCFVVLIISSILFVKLKIRSFIELTLYTSCSYVLVYLFVVITGFIDASNKHSLHIGTAIILLIGGVIATIAVSSIFMLLQPIVLYIVNSILNDKH